MAVMHAEDDDPLRALAKAAEARRELERAEAVAVRRARLNGLDWTLIAAALRKPKRAVKRLHG